MSKHTQHDCLIAGLQARGLGRNPTPNGRYTKLERLHPATKAPNGFWFVGPAGALRYGKNASTSLAVNEAFHASVLECGLEALTRPAVKTGITLADLGLARRR